MSNRNIAIFGSGMSDVLAQQLRAARAIDLGFEQGVKAERERLADLIEAAKNLRQALIDFKESNDCGEIHWAERMTDPVDLLVKALNDYEATNE